MKQDITNNIDIIEQSLELVSNYSITTFNRPTFIDYRRELKKIRFSVEERCSIAAYGQSQVGKSYLINSLLSSSSQPFRIEHGGLSYSFIMDINPSALRNNEVESTGLVTRFSCSKPILPDKIRVRNLSVTDIVLILVDSYYKDIKAESDSIPGKEIDTIMANYTQQWANSPKRQSYVVEDDVRDIYDYLKVNLKPETAVVRESRYFSDLAANIEKVPVDQWADVFSLLWNRNQSLTDLFNRLIAEYKKLRFEEEVFIPFDGVRAIKGTILDICWLDNIVTGGVLDDNQTYDPCVGVYDKNGKLLCNSFHKAMLAALIAEVTFYLPESIKKDRPFLEHMDLLDFPGARSRSSIEENAVGDSVISFVLRRGKVAFLFNKYSNSERISSILFCHHHNQSAESSVADSVSNWVKANIGGTIAERTKRLSTTGGISPLFFIATKFNIDMARQPEETPERKANHWARFDKIYPEMLKGKDWYDTFSIERGKSVAFQNIYPIRSFVFSNGVLFDGYSESTNSEEIQEHILSDYPNYLGILKGEFLSNPEVKKHFANPETTWNDVATINNDGSKRIIEKLSALAPQLVNSRRDKVLERLQYISQSVREELSRYYVTGDVAEQHKRLKKTIQTIRLRVVHRVGDQPDLFGRIIDRLMIPSSLLHTEAYNIYTFHTHTPVAIDKGAALRMAAGIVGSDDYAEGLKKLKAHCLADNDVELRQIIQEEYALSVEEVLQPGNSLNATLAGVVTERLILVWRDFLKSKTSELKELIESADEVVKMLQDLFSLLDVKMKLFKRIQTYESKIDKQYRHIPIGDLAATVFNDFVSTVGSEYYQSSHETKVADVAQTLSLPLSNTTTLASFSSLEEALRNLPMADNKEQLQKQPFWSHFTIWKNRVENGLILTSDVQNCDLDLNDSLGNLIARTDALYQQK